MESLSSIDLSSIREYFVCPICKNYFKEPTTCACGHTFCKKCISSYKDSTSETGYYSNTFKCPVCKSNLQTIEEKNVIIDNLLGSLIPEVANKRREKQERKKQLALFQGEYLRSVRKTRIIKALYEFERKPRIVHVSQLFQDVCNQLSDLMIHREEFFYCLYDILQYGWPTWVFPDKPSTTGDTTTITDLPVLEEEKIDQSNQDHPDSKSSVDLLEEVAPEGNDVLKEENVSPSPIEEKNNESDASALKSDCSCDCDSDSSGCCSCESDDDEKRVENSPNKKVIKKYYIKKDYGLRFHDVPASPSRHRRSSSMIISPCHTPAVHSQFDQDNLRATPLIIMIGGFIGPRHTISSKDWLPDKENYTSDMIDVVWLSLNQISNNEARDTCCLLLGKLLNVDDKQLEFFDGLKDLYLIIGFNVMDHIRANNLSLCSESTTDEALKITC